MIENGKTFLSTAYKTALIKGDQKYDFLISYFKVFLITFFQHFSRFTTVTYKKTYKKIIADHRQHLNLPHQSLKISSSIN